MIIDQIKSIFERDLDKLRLEIEAYKNEEILWHIEKILPIQQEIYACI